MEIAQKPTRRPISISLCFHLFIFEWKEFQKVGSYRRVWFWVSVYVIEETPNHDGTGVSAWMDQSNYSLGERKATEPEVHIRGT
jgi:hypothetical protein